MKTALKVIVSTVAIAGVALVIAQMPMGAPGGAPPKPKTGSDTITFKSTLGSFKILGSGVDPARGNLSVGFRGTMLLTDPKGQYRFEGNVRKEYEDTAHKKVAYFGNGRLILDGSARSIQFFGSDIDGKFKGFGMVRLYGEFDNKYETGTYQYAGDVARPWGTGGMNLSVPQMIYDQSGGVVPKVEDVK